MLCFSHRLYFMALGRIFALQYILRLETFCVSYHPPFQSARPTAAWQGLWALPFAVRQPPLCSHCGDCVCLSPLLSSPPCSIPPGVSDVLQTAQFSPVPFGLSACLLVKHARRQAELRWGREQQQTGVLMPAVVWSDQLQMWPRLPTRY